MKKYILIIFFTLLASVSFASNKKNIIKNLENIDNISFDFEQNINGKIEKGNCKLQYPKKIFCKYDLKNEKILVSNGKSLVIKTKSSYYLYPIKKTPLNLILDKNFLISKINNLDERVLENRFINYKFTENDNEINIFFDKETYDLIGWQTIDIYQNLVVTYMYNIKSNTEIKKDQFKLPKQN